MFGKKKTKDKKQESTFAGDAGKPKVQPYEIHVMPQKFHKYSVQSASSSGGGGSRKSSGGSSGKLIVIIVIIFLVITAGVVGAFIYFSKMQPNLPNIDNENKNDDIIINENENENENMNENENENDNENINENENENENDNLNLNKNDNENINENENKNENNNDNNNINDSDDDNVIPEQILDYSPSKDTDKDGLTDVEELLYSTEKRAPDSDSDGYDDGEEVINGYNPKSAGGSILAVSGLVNKYSNPVYDYEIFHPKTWLALPTDQSLQEIIFQSSTGEFVQVLIEENEDEKDLVDWYLTQSPASNISDLERKSNDNGFDVLISPDKLTYYLSFEADNTIVYIITYNIGDLKEVNFLTTFEMMYNNFVLATPAVPEPEPEDTHPENNDE